MVAESHLEIGGDGPLDGDDRAAAQQPTQQVQSNDYFLALSFIQTLELELAINAFFGPILQGAAATLGKPVNRYGAAILNALWATPGGGVLVVR